MRYLSLLVFALIVGLSAPVSADFCCPDWCEKQVERNKCIPLGNPIGICKSIECPGNPPPPGPPDHGVILYYEAGTGRPCYATYPDPASRDGAADVCVTHLMANAGIWGCLFEDDAGRAEDRRTGLSCFDRQTTLAKQCRARCLSYAEKQDSCRSSDEVWVLEKVFGEIGGTVYGSARVDLCGPRLKRGFDSKERTQRFPPIHRRIEDKTQPLPPLR